MSNRTKLLEKSAKKSTGIIGRLIGSVTNYRGFSWAFLAILMLTVSVQQSSAQITTHDFGPVSYCPGTGFTVSYTVPNGGPMLDGNEFRVQLSDASGNFINNNNSSNIIGTLESIAISGTINATIPPTTPPSTTYRVRVVSTSPPMNHFIPFDDNGNNITVLSRTITPTYPALTNLNVGSSVSVPFTVNCNYISGNNFILELSDRTGNFSASGYPRTVATLSGVSNGTLTGNIPSVPSGAGYRLRIRSTNTPSNSTVSNAFAINPVLTSTECVCNNDQTPNLNDGTYAVTLIISNADGSAMGAGESYRIASSTSLRNTSNGTLGNPSFIYCDGLGCPSGVDPGEYYLRVYVENSAAFTVDVDGPDPDIIGDFGLNTSCGTPALYPAIPVFPAQLLDRNCLVPGENVFTNGSNAIFSEVNSLVGVTLPDGFYQDVTGNTGGDLRIVDGEVNEADNNPFMQLYLIRQASNMCRVSSSKQFKVFNSLSAELVDLPIFCRAPRLNDSISLDIMLGPDNSGGGTFNISGVTIVNNKVPVNNGFCHQVTYTVIDSCGNVLTDTKNLQVTVRPAPQFNFDAGQPASPLCATSPTTLTITRTSTGTNPIYSVTTNNPTYPHTSISGNGTDNVIIEFPAIPHIDEVTTSVRYTICLEETNNAPPSCGSITPPTEPCAETFCRTYIIYRDRYNCGADNLFPSQCDTFDPDVCEISTQPSLDFGCSFFTIQGPNVLTSVINFDGGVAGCNQDEITGNFNVSLFGIDASQVAGGKKLKSFPGMNVICSIFGFKIFGWRPLGALYKLLGCEKTIAQFVLGLISQLAGGDGGGYLVMADTDGDGAFDYLVDDGPFPSDGFTSFSIPNRVRGVGAITVRAVGGWVNSPSDVCGDLGIEGINLLDLLPIGAIPIVGAVIEDILAAAGCNVNIAFSVDATEKIQVINDEPAIYVNCNESGYIFAQTLECNIPVGWSIPVALEGCGGSQAIPYRGYLENPTTDVTLFAGTTLPPSFTAITEPGIYQISGPLPGSILTPGTYLVSYQAVSCNGIPSVCAFNVEVTSGDPILECPRDLTISTDVDLCSRVVNGLAPYQGIGCSSIINYRFTNPVSGTVVETNDTDIGTHNIPDGYAFELGTTVITYTMQVDINGDGDYDDPGETQQCDFSITVEDNQAPNAICLTVQLHLNNEGAGTVYASDIQDSIYMDGGSTDNCFGDLLLEISRNGIDYAPSLDFDCDDKGQHIVRLRVTDASGNVSFCKGVVQVLDYFEGYKLDLDVPEVCFEPFQNQYDFSPYIVIAQPDGTNIRHQDVGTLGSRIEGGFGISAFLPDAGSTNDPGTITPDGVYTLGTGTGWITISYVLSIDGQVNQYDEDSPLVGCFRMVHDVFRVEKLDPVWSAGYMCCDQLPVWLGGAAWDGTGDPPIPAGMLSLTDIRGAYPGDVYGEWIGQGVSFVDPDGIPFTGDEFFMFDPNGLDGSYSLTYIIGDEPCEFKYTQEILVTCQDLHIDISDYTVCPANWVDEKQVLVNLDDRDLVVSTTGFDEIGADGGHYGNGIPVQDLDSVVIRDGRVVIPGFFAPAIRSKAYEICVTTFQVTPFGCADVFCYTITVEDLIAPDFQNCPRDPIVVDAPQGWCSSFVNFELPWAYDNCMGLYARLERADSTGLNSGDLFPVGLTILSYLATDTVGNQSYCELKIIVNDYHTPPSIVCPNDVTQVNDPEKCGAIVNNIAPVKFEDNCPDNITILYETKDPDGKVIACGFEDASGDFFPVGTSQVKYRIEDQPLILITEIVQDGVITGMEVTNFGPANMDITCSNFVLKDENGNVIESYMVPTANNKSTYGTTPIYPPDPIMWVIPNPNVIPVGGTFTHTFNTSIPAGQIAKYCFTFLNRVIDEATINDLVKGNVILRKNVCDHDLQSDFIAATPCDPGSFGFLNPGLPTMTPNGTTRGLQNYAPSVDECTFNITIKDLESPYCIKHDSIEVINTLVPSNIDINSCLVSTITMPAGIVNDVNIHNLQIIIPNAGSVTAYLSSPSGTRIELFSGICNNQPNIDINLDETIVWVPAPSVTNALCNPMGQGGTYRPLESFKAFHGEEGEGEWILEIYSTGIVPGVLVNWELQILYQLPYDQGDVVLQNAPGRCDTTFSWIHPILKDNCCFGTVSVDYTFTNDVTGEFEHETQVILNSNGTINLQGLRETRIFKVGVTVIEYTLIDQYGNINTCGFTVTVLDTEEPMFTIGCPDRVINLSPGECLGSLDLYTPPATDNCGIDSTRYYFEDGTLADISRLPIGSYNIVMKVFDIYGNVGTCIFNVTVNEFIPQNPTLACNDALNISLGSDCQAIVNADMILEGNNYRCYDNYCITIEDLFGFPHDNLFTLEDEGKTFKVSISDCLSGNLVSCWGYINIEEKLTPILECPRDTVVACNFDIEAVDTLGHLLLGEAVLISCAENAKIAYQDEWTTFGNCDNPRATVKRIWSVIDDEGRKSECIQNITIRPLNLDDVVYPSDIEFDQAINCADVINNPELTHPNHTGWPLLNGIQVNKSGGLCMVSLNYTDEIYDICNGSYEILRYWKVRNMCYPISADNPRTHIQVIKVLDKSGPKVIDCPADITVSVDPWTCRVDLELPQPGQIFDACSDKVQFKYLIYGGGEIITEKDSTGVLHVYGNYFYKGVHTIKYFYKDECANESVCSFKVTVVDATAPIAIAKQNIVLGLSNDGTGNGYAKLFAWQVDNGSYDQCTRVKLELRRLDGGSCYNVGSNNHNNNSTYNNHNGLTSASPGVSWLHPDDHANDTDGGEYVTFCCEDIPAGDVFGEHVVELRVWDDGNMNGIIGDNQIINGLKDNFNTTWATVQVENKIAPVIVCPVDVTVTCDMDINLSIGKEVSIDSVDMSMTGTPNSIDLCGNLAISYVDQGSLDACGSGVITRTFKVKKGTVESTCTQKITVNDIKVPFTVTFAQNNGLTEWDKCSFNADDVRDASNSRIKRPIVNYGQCDIVGETFKIDTFFFEDGACKKWKVSYTYKSWCSGDELGPFVHYYAFKDEVSPEVACADQMFPAVVNPANPNGGCEGSVVLEAYAKDSLICAEESWIKWQVFFDGWSNGTVDRLGSSFVNKAWANQWVAQPKLINGQPNPIWAQLQAQHQGVILDDIVYVSYVRPTKASGESVKLPAFTLPAENIQHKVLWKITDGCGNVDQCESTVMVVDKKAPTPYCVQLSTAIMQTNPKMVEIWAKDFDRGAYDNCSPQNKLYFTFDEIHPVLSKLNVEHYFKARIGQLEGVDATLAEYNQGRAQKWIPGLRSSGKVWTTCGEFSVRVNVWDEAWNTDYCESELKVIGCGGNRIVSGHVATATGNNVSDAIVIFESNLPEYPKQFITDKAGDYSMEVQSEADYNVHVIKNDDYLNGVSTIDIVMIQRYILGLETFVDPYQLIASDANNDGNISASDLTEIRRVILGVKNEFKNDSWRFPVKHQSMSMPNVMPYKEQYDYIRINDNMSKQDFVAVKIGDVNSSVELDLRQPTTESRTSNAFVMNVASQSFEKDELISIPFTSEGNQSIIGYQLTMNIENLELVSIDRGVFNLDMSQVGVFNEKGKITMSYAAKSPVELNTGDVLFTLQFKAKSSGNLEEALSLNSEITKSESYDAAFKVGKVDLRFTNANNEAVVLYQNEPNPFIAQTVISYYLPAAADAILSIHDVLGKQIKQYQLTGEQGLNTIQINKQELGVSGVMYYTLKSGDFTATKKMIVVE